jgi:hypothetical protein
MEKYQIFRNEKIPAKFTESSNESTRQTFDSIFAIQENTTEQIIAKEKDIIDSSEKVITFDNENR